MTTSEVRAASVGFLVLGVVIIWVGLTQFCQSYAVDGGCSAPYSAPFVIAGTLVAIISLAILVLPILREHTAKGGTAN